LLGQGTKIKITYKIPLLVKVVSLYVFAALPIWFILQRPADTSALDNNQYLSEIMAEEPEPTPIEAVTGTPVRLEIPGVGINLPILDGDYDPTTDNWTLTTTSVHYATMTTPINNLSGHTLIYGHNNRDLLGPTRDIVPYELLLIYTEEGKTFVYTYTGDELVDPTDTSVLDNEPDKPHLTLLTCEGLFYEQRRLMGFEFVEVLEDGT
jgi:LPXTG-site transpeptidase (sortase) family protein